MEEYTTYRLGDIAECTLGKMLDQKKNKGNPQVYLGNVAVRWGSFNVDPSQTMLFEDKELDKYQAIKGDIVLCEGGEPGRCAIWEEDRPICIQKALHRIRVNEDIASPYYVYYYLTNLVKSGKAEPFFTGSTIKHLPREKLISLELSLPCFEEQKRRAAIIRSLDDKIALNNRINHNLEEQAQALYKSWFVDFEPFKDEIFVESELGMIPSGWRVGTLSEIADVTMGQSPSGSTFNEDGRGIVFYQGRTEFGFRFPSIKLYTTAPTRFAEPHSVLMSVRAPVGDINVALDRCCIGRGLAAITAKDDAFSFVLYALKGKSSELDLYNGEGTVFGSINRKDLEGLSVLIPPMSIVKRFNDCIRPIDDSIEITCKEIVNLSCSRDSLLPRLMSGQLSFDEFDC